MKKILSKNKGFTLIEIMVATSIFMIIMLVAMGALITSSNNAKNAQALRSAMDNVNFALESMTRSLRMGTDYTCITASTFILPVSATPDCPLGSSGALAVAFTPAKTAPARNTAYALTSRINGTGVLQRCVNALPCADLVASNINIKKLLFYVKGSSPTTDTMQPSVYIIIKGVVTIKGVDNVFAIQTMASQRSSE